MTNATAPGLWCEMPVVSRFLGIAISIQYRDHDPPHFHAHYGEHEVLVEIETGKTVGYFPRRGLKLVEEWRNLRQVALMEDWHRARERLPLKPIDPLE